MTADDIEQWQPIPGYQGYEASTLGRIRSVRIMAATMHPEGYLTARMTPFPGVPAITTYRHRLVALAFWGLPANPSMVAHHKDGNRKNNRPENLEWLTNRDNSHASRRKPFTGTRKPRRRVRWAVT